MSRSFLLHRTENRAFCIVAAPSAERSCVPPPAALGSPGQHPSNAVYPPPFSPLLLKLLSSAVRRRNLAQFAGFDSFLDRCAILAASAGWKNNAVALFPALFFQPALLHFWVQQLCGPWPLHFALLSANTPRSVWSPGRHKTGDGRGPPVSGSAGGMGLCAVRRSSALRPASQG